MIARYIAQALLGSPAYRPLSAATQLKTMLKRAFVEVAALNP